MGDGHGDAHPETFDEIIARGFPRGAPSASGAPKKRRGGKRRAGGKALEKLAAAASVVTRADQAGLSADMQNAFKNAIVRLVADGTYEQLVRHHMDMSHMMHGSMGEVGLYRFLAWHRRYLVAFERELQRVDGVLRPSAPQPLSVPYWRWQDPFPKWMAGFLPARDPASGNMPAPRKNMAPPEKASAADVDIIVNQFSIQDTGLTGENDYTKFTWGLEGWGLRPDGSSLPAHNHGHAWLGGVMNNTRTSPTDPIFWLHHAEVDRLWQKWRAANPTPKPRLTGSDLVMDPWAESYTDLLDPKALGYVYDSSPL